MKTVISGTAFLLCIVLLLTGCTGNKKTDSAAGNSGLGKYELAKAEYPEMHPYPDEAKYTSPTGNFDNDGFHKEYTAWRESKAAQREQYDGYNDNMSSYYTALVREMIGRGEENTAFSPLNIYLALSMLAEITDGSSREQILKLLGIDTIEELRKKADALWNANYCNDGAYISILADSLWLRDDMEYNSETVKALAEIYHASAYRGEMGSEAFNNAMRAWLDEQTGGLLKDNIASLEFTPETILSIASTVYFRAKWNGRFNAANTKQETFHAVSGDILCDYMHKSQSMTYYWSEKFSAIKLSFEGGGGMWLILPDENISFEDLLSDSKVFELCSGAQWDDSKSIIVNLALPKFDFTSKYDLKNTFKDLGITAVFDSSESDFSPIIVNSDDVSVSQAEHTARVTIDEEGCTAVAYTVMATAGASMPPPDEIDFILDRPFMFVITGNDSSMLFIGTVARP